MTQQLIYGFNWADWIWCGGQLGADGPSGQVDDGDGDDNDEVDITQGHMKTEGATGRRWFLHMNATCVVSFSLRQIVE